jgi:hypothetical protein
MQNRSTTIIAADMPSSACRANGEKTYPTPVLAALAPAEHQISRRSGHLLILSSHKA